MAALRDMPKVELDQAALKAWGSTWLAVVASVPKEKPKAKRPAKKGEAAAPAPDPAEIIPDEIPLETKTKKPNSFDRKQSMDFGYQFDHAFAKSVATMLGDIPILMVNSDNLLPPQADCMEVGKTRIVGGIRPQNYDAAYRPDGPRIVYDSKTLNERKSIGKNWQNMINDLSTEATTVHTRFPMCIVAFIVAVPRPALDAAQERDLIRTLQRLGTRSGELDQTHLAEAIALVVWNPEDGSVSQNVPPKETNLRLEDMHKRVNAAYLARYANLPPHQETAVEGGESDEDGGETPGVT
jgi:hypothetical protein